MPVWEPSIHGRGLHRADVGSAFHMIVGARRAAASRRLPRPGRAARRHHPDPPAVPPQRRQHRRPVPGRGPGVLPLRHRRSGTRSSSTRRRAASDPAAAGRARAAIRLPEPTDSAIGARRDRGGRPARTRPASRRHRWSGRSPLGGSSVRLGGHASGGRGGSASRSRPDVPPILERVRRHPYVRLALDSSFSALWMGQLVSALGDRIHQVALAFVVFDATESALAVGRRLPRRDAPEPALRADRGHPRRPLGPPRGDDRQRPPARGARPPDPARRRDEPRPRLPPRLPRDDRLDLLPAGEGRDPAADRRTRDDLVPANSALWVGETFADIGGYVVAGLFVALLGSQLPLAFWVDSVTYVASALLIASISVAPIAVGGGEAGGGGARARPSPPRRRALGWRSVRSATSSARAGASCAASRPAGQHPPGDRRPVHARDLPGPHAGVRRGTRSIAARSPTREAYGFLEGAIGAGQPRSAASSSGSIGSRLGARADGRSSATWRPAPCVGAPGRGGQAAASRSACAFGVGVGNLAFVIPSQTLFQRRTPPEMMGRVLGLRFSLVFGSMTLAMGVGGVLGEAFGAAPIIGVFGLVTVAAGFGRRCSSPPFATPEGLRVHCAAAPNRSRPLETHPLR